MYSFWSYTVRKSETLAHLHVFFKLSDGTAGFFDENWSSIVKNKSLNMTNTPYTFNDRIKSH